MIAHSRVASHYEINILYTIRRPPTEDDRGNFGFDLNGFRRNLQLIAMVVCPAQSRIEEPSGKDIGRCDLIDINA